MEFFTQLVAGTQGLTLALFAIAFLAIWFLPAILALFFNRKQFKWILLACIPAGLSFIAWGGLLVWATTGKVVERYRAAAGEGSV